MWTKTVVELHCFDTRNESDRLSYILTGVQWVKKIMWQKQGDACTVSWIKTTSFLENKVKHTLKFVALGTCLLGSTAMAGTVDLSSWGAEGDGSWALQGVNNDAVYQSINTPKPAAFINKIDSQGAALSGKIKVDNPSGDDDFIGFVLGFDTGDFGSATADYLLIDWKRNDQYVSGWGDGDKGLSISRVSGALSEADAWAHTGAVTELDRGTSLGNVGWSEGVEYTFDLIFTASAVQVKVNNSLELNIAGSFENGSFGFYNFSQAKVTYSGIEENEAVISPVPLPAGGFLLLAGLGGLGALRRKKKS
ncbi:VPLPA-CTERM sorting domain-containing protein [uncultured Shimia sp.]|uniref:VPLPA-CTERM sorting domain-containing protein n=1 Tax=uncultured Shimia sp. TaxID=573152 RepID=UPI0026331D24|nr:VPLPA-CTERM sorting domain-containing protein [uncultured Shimia sp.]